MVLKNPVHPGEILREDVLADLGLGVDWRRLAHEPCVTNATVRVEVSSPGPASPSGCGGVAFVVPTRSRDDARGGRVLSMSVPARWCPDYATPGPIGRDPQPATSEGPCSRSARRR